MTSRKSDLKPPHHLPPNGPIWSPGANMTALALIKQTNPVPGTVIMYSTSLFFYFTISQNEEGGTANICLDRCQWPPSHCLD